MRSRAVGAARRYGRALLDAAAADAAGVEGVHERLIRLGAVLTEHPEVGRFLAHPRVASEKKDALLAALLPEERPAGIVTRLARLLIERQRLGILPDILECFTVRRNAQRGVQPAAVVSAQPLDARQLAALKATLERAGGGAVEISARVEPGLGGGLVVSMGGRTLDGSVRGRLRMLRERLRQAAVAR